MANDTEKRVHNLLHRMATEGQSALKELVWTELNYPYVDVRLSTRTWSDAARQAIQGAPRLLARYDAGRGGFSVIIAHLAFSNPDRAAPLSLSAERLIITQLLADHPYALFIFTDREERAWHFVNVTYRRPEADPDEGPPPAVQPVIRRIAVGPGMQLRTAAERIAMLDLETLSPDLTGLSAMAIQQRHATAFDVEAVTKDFFTAYRRLFERAEAAITGLPDPDDMRLFTLRLFNRLLFIVFLERKGWLTFQDRTDYLRALWDSYRHQEVADEHNFYRDRLKLLFFSGLNNPSNRDIAGIHPRGIVGEKIGHVPYLNGGLFEEEALDRNPNIVVPDDIFADAIDALLYHYNFTVTESTPLDIEVAVDPEMLGRIFEELVTGRHESGSYYTPKPIVAFMCREALKSYLADLCPIEATEALAAFVDHRDGAGLREPETVLTALRTVRVCDPACGSGAYLVGMLHELMDLRRALFGGGPAPTDAVADAVYQRKLETIQHCLYGVDIDPFAVNIARLRLWLSLIVEFQGETPPPLPNLAYKIEVGDSLTGQAPQQLQPDLFMYQEVQEYLSLKHRFLIAHSSDKKRLKTQIDDAENRIAAYVGGSGTPGAFEWAVRFAEIFIPEADGAATLTGEMTGIVNAVPGQLQLATREGRPPGFDIIVANPPYVRQELLSREQKKQYQTIYPEVYTGTADLYVYFYARALHLLREGGVASFISSNKWLRAGYGKKLRAHLGMKATVATIVDFGDLPLFSATAYPMIITLLRGAPEPDHEARAMSVDDLSVVEQLPEVVAKTAWHQPQQSLPSAGWALVPPRVRSLIEKLRDQGTPLGQYIDGKIYYGIKTGYNTAFVIDDNTRKRLLEADPKSAEIIKPWLRGRDIKRWRAPQAGLYVLYIPWSLKIDMYPAVHAHLLAHRKQLARRAEVRHGRYPWYALSRYAAQYIEEFSKKKVMFPHFNLYPNFGLNTVGTLGNDKTYIIPNASAYLLGILNSAVTGFYLSQICPTVRGNYMEFRTTYVESIPIPQADGIAAETIERLANDLVSVQGQGPHVEAWERDLDALVYDLYDLTPDEIALIEKETRRD